MEENMDIIKLLKLYVNNEKLNIEINKYIIRTISSNFIISSC